ncbi:Uncharacterised protein [uncultured archaeon]|nr:Uncharacterised protein [uncultured archaeon]
MSSSKKSSKKVSKKSGLSKAGKALLELALKATPTPTLPAKKTSPVPVPVPINPQVKAVEDVLAKSPWGPGDTRTKLLADVAAAILGKPVTVPYAPSTCSSSCSTKRGMVVVVTMVDVPGYTKGQPVMFKSTGGSHGLTVKDGKVVRMDYSLPVGKLGDPSVLRYATKSEIEGLVKRLTATPSLVQDTQSWMELVLA